MTSLIVFIWGIFSFFILWLAVHFYVKKDWRSTFISASLFSGVGVWMLTEILSLFNKLNIHGIFVGCLLGNLLLLILLFFLYKKNNLIYPKKLSAIHQSKSFYFLIFILVTTFL